jgi:alpha-D-ribose 1-methylphosphonate 5-triphosphate diphosphatase PhnM
LRPAGAVGLAGSAGSLEPGRRADMVLVRGEGDAPAVQATVVDGRVVYTLSYRKCIN